MFLRSVRVIGLHTVEPVTLAEAKAQVGLTLEQEDDDALLLRLIATARALIEKRLGAALVARRLRATFAPESADNPALYVGFGGLQGFGAFGGSGLVPGYPSASDPRDFRLPAPPLLEDVDHPLSVTIGGVTVDPSAYVVDPDAMPAVIRFTDAPSVPPRGALVVVFWAGPAPGVPISPILQSAILLLVGHFWRNRESTTDDPLRELPHGLETMLAAESITGAY